MLLVICSAAGKVLQQTRRQTLPPLSRAQTAAQLGVATPEMSAGLLTSLESECISSTEAEEVLRRVIRCPQEAAVSRIQRFSFSEVGIHAFWSAW